MTKKTVKTKKLVLDKNTLRDLTLDERVSAGRYSNLTVCGGSCTHWCCSQQC